jgi:hypothetical protein
MTLTRQEQKIAESKLTEYKVERRCNEFDYAITKDGKFIEAYTTKSIALYEAMRKEKANA